MFKCIIAGTRTFNDYSLLCSYADYILSRIQDDIEIVSGGGANGADLLGERYAEERGYSIARFPANWNEYGRGAGPRRNREMAMYSDALIAYWDGKSNGTKNMIEEARARGLKVRIKIYR